MATTVKDNLGNEYTERKGLEGPFNFGGVVLYYDTKEGKYWNPRSDFYLSYDEFKALTT